ncbi:MAG: DUF3662 and FHA domain-containing protein [Acidimicrobiales bacterium]
MGIRGFEGRLERLVEGAFARVFKSGLRPLEIAKRITREMDDNRTTGVSGETVVPNHFWVYVSPADFAEFSEIESTLCGELADAARDHAVDEGYVFKGPVKVLLTEAEQYPTGAFQVASRLKEGELALGPGALVFEGGERVALRNEVMGVGRLSENAVVVSDPNVSRRHAEVRPTAFGYQLVDLGSTNGMVINGTRVTEHVLRSGDEIVFGTTKMHYEVG